MYNIYIGQRKSKSKERMKMRMSDIIEEFIKQMFEKEDTIEGKRSKTVGIPVRDGEKDRGRESGQREGVGSAEENY